MDEDGEKITVVFTQWTALLWLLGLRFVYLRYTTPTLTGI